MALASLILEAVGLFVVLPVLAIEIWFSRRHAERTAEIALRGSMLAYWLLTRLYETDWQLTGGDSKLFGQMLGSLESDISHAFGDGSGIAKFLDKLRDMARPEAGGE